MSLKRAVRGARDFACSHRYQFPSAARDRRSLPYFQVAQSCRRHAHDVVDFVREAKTFAAAVNDRRKHGAKEQRKAIGILVIRADGLANQFSWIAADHRHRALAFQFESILAQHIQTHDCAAHVVQREVLIEQANERTHRAGRVVVLGFAEQQRATPFDVA